MKNKYLLLTLVIAGMVLVGVSCAPTSTPTLVPTAIPTNASTTATTATPTKALSIAPTSAATVAPTKAASSPTQTSGGAAQSPGMATPTMIAGVPKSPAEVQRIKPEELKALLDGGADLQIVDNQTPQRFAVIHLPDAFNLPWAIQIPSGMSLPKDKLIVMSCMTEHEENSSDVAFQLITQFGYTKVMVLEGGIQKWKDLSYPTETGFFD